MEAPEKETDTPYTGTVAAQAETISQLRAQLAAKDAEIERLKHALRRIVEINEAFQVEEYGSVRKETIEMAIARAALNGGEG